jgi:hypothetical protein
MLFRRSGQLRGRSQLSRGICPDLESGSPARSSLRAATYSDLSWRQGHPRRAGVSAQHLSRLAQLLPALPARWTSSIEPRAATPRASPAKCNCGAGSKTDSPQPCFTPIPNQSTTTQPWAARATCTRAGATDQSASASPSLAIAQNWLNPRAERSLSSFDQRTWSTCRLQYTSGQGLGGGDLMNGWRGRLFKEWTV